MGNFKGRLNAAVKAAVGIFSETSGREAYGLLSGLWPGGTGTPPVPGARERQAAFADLPWLHAIADKVAHGIASVEWTLSYPKNARDGRAVRAKSVQRATTQAQRRAMIKRLPPDVEMVPVPEDHPMYTLLDNGNSVMTGLATRYVTALHWDLEGEAFWLKERNRVGAPIAVWPIPPDWVRATPTQAFPYWRVGFRGWQGQIPDADILWLQRHNPANPYGRGTGLARALADELETDEYAARLIKQTFLNQQRPDFIVYPEEGEWSGPERVRLQEDWAAQHEGYWRAGRPRISSSKLGVYEFASTDMRHLQMVQLREFSADLVRKIWGVPPEMMGIVEPGASRATIDKASYIFTKWVLVPRLEMLRALLQERLAPEYDERLVIDYVNPVEENNEFNLQAAQANPSVLTVDEWRALSGHAPLPDGGGEVFLVVQGATVKEEFEEAEPPPMVPGASPTGALPDTEDEEEEEEEEPGPKFWERWGR